MVGQLFLSEDDALLSLERLGALHANQSSSGVKGSVDDEDSIRASETCACPVGMLRANHAEAGEEAELEDEAANCRACSSSCPSTHPLRRSSSDVKPRADRIRRHVETLALWRLPDNWSDWTIILGARHYHVHRVHLASSEFFKGCFGFPAGQTDLTAILPQLCHGIFDSLLDYLYGEEITLQPETLALFAKAAHVLQITDLLSKVLCAAPDLMSALSAPYVLTSAQILQEADGEQDGMKDLQQMAHTRIAHHVAFDFGYGDHLAEGDSDRHFCQRVAALQFTSLLSVLTDDNVARNAGFVLDIILISLPAREFSEEQKQQLWKVCRFSRVSSTNAICLALRYAPAEILVTGWGQKDPRHPYEDCQLNSENKVARIAGCVNELGWAKVGVCIMALARRTQHRNMPYLCCLALALSEHAELARLVSDLCMQALVQAEIEEVHQKQVIEIVALNAAYKDLFGSDDEDMCGSDNDNGSLRPVHAEPDCKIHHTCSSGCSSSDISHEESDQDCPYLSDVQDMQDFVKYYGMLLFQSPHLQSHLSAFISYVREIGPSLNIVQSLGPMLRRIRFDFLEEVNSTPFEEIVQLIAEGFNLEILSGSTDAILQIVETILELGNESTQQVLAKKLQHAHGNLLKAILRHPAILQFGRRSELIKSLARARFAQLDLQRPVFSWCQPRANFHSKNGCNFMCDKGSSSECPGASQKDRECGVEAFLRGPKKEKTFAMFQGIAQARELARSIQDGMSGCSAITEAFGIGRDAQLHIKKTKRIWEEEVEKPHHMDLQEAASLKCLLGRTPRCPGTPEPKGTKRKAELVQQDSSTEMEDMEKSPKTSICRGTQCHRHTGSPTHRSIKASRSEAWDE